MRWHQRLENFSTALNQLRSAVLTARQRSLSDLGLIQSFEFTHELAWNVMKDYFEYQGNPQITGSRDAAREAFRRGLITDGDSWMEMIKSRNQTTHTYNRVIADEILKKTVETYFPLFEALLSKMERSVQN